MSQLYPLKFKPIYKEKIWGGKKIKTVLNKDFSPLTNCGELWALSGVEGDVSVVENGFLQGNSLNEIVEIYMDDIVGDVVYGKFGNEFPVLIKFLNSNDYLSVQVHPDDKLAFERHGCYGKNELWYIIDADKDSDLIIGFEKGIDKNKYVKALNQGYIKDILNHVKIVKDDVFYMPAGRVHAIGKGVLLAEIQQTSDITYRIYDWDRTDSQGNKRELHTEQAIDAIDFSFQEDYYTHYSRLNNISNSIMNTPFFSVNMLSVDVQMLLDLSRRDSFSTYVCVEGSADITGNNSVVNVVCGETVLIPADIFDVIINPKPFCRLLEVYI